MNERKLQKLFTSARVEPPPPISPDLETRVMRELRREPRPERMRLFDQLDALFPRLALAAALVIGACVAAEVCLSSLAPMDLPEGVAQVSEQWLFAVR